MNWRLASKMLRFVVVLGVCAAVAAGQAPPQTPRRTPAPTTNVTVDGREAMFATMCALYASGFEGDVSADNWTTFRAQMREKMKQQEGPAVEAMREFYQKHKLRDPAATLSRYIWFGLVSGPAPKFQPVLRRDELPPEVLQLEGFSEILSLYYTEQKIGQLWRQVQPIYNTEIERLHDSVSQVVLISSAYLREILDPTTNRSFTIIVEPLVGRITNVRNFGDHYAIVLSGGEQIPTDVVRHAFLHFLLDPLPMTYSHVTVVKRPLFEQAAKAPRMPPDLRDDYFSWFAECTVRAVELKLKKLSPGEREVALTVDDASGYVMVRPILTALTGFEKSEPSMKNYFPDLVRSIDLKIEQPRVAAIVFAPAESRASEADLAAEEVARKRAAVPTSVPNDQDAIAALTEGERRIAEKNPRAAEISFKTVLAKYPEQTRAWYGLGLVALLDHDGPRAKDIFGRLTKGEHAATLDPMVMSWSHVYLGRIFEDDGDLERAKNEYQAALAVDGVSVQVQSAAQRGLDGLQNRKSGERP